MSRLKASWKVVTVTASASTAPGAWSTVTVLAPRDGIRPPRYPATSRAVKTNSDRNTSDRVRQGFFWGLWMRTVS